MKRLYILTIFSIVGSLLIFSCKEFKYATVPTGKGLVLKKEWLVNSPPIITPEKDSRPADQTFLTFPEWFLVFSSEEQADYFKNHTATRFPYLTHVSQIWKSYSIVKDQIRGNYKPNPGYHFMIQVIGISTTVEYFFKAVYENVIGRITDPGPNKTLTEEDKFYGVYMNDYVRFIKLKPWYEFDFKQRIPELWEISLVGKQPLRKLERRSFLTGELLLKTAYGKLIKAGTGSIYEEALPTTVVLANKLPQQTNDLPKLQVKEIYSDSSVLLALPRYDDFNLYATELAKRGVNFKEIAGNNSAILLTVLVPINYNNKIENSQPIFTQIVSSNPIKKRIALAVQVKDLNKLLLQLNKENITIEHIFDF